LLFIHELMCRLELYIDVLCWLNIEINITILHITSALDVFLFW